MLYFIAGTPLHLSSEAPYFPSETLSLLPAAALHIQVAASQAPQQSLLSRNKPAAPIGDRSELNHHHPARVMWPGDDGPWPASAAGPITAAALLVAAVIIVRRLFIPGLWPSSSETERGGRRAGRPDQRVSPRARSGGRSSARRRRSSSRRTPPGRSPSSSGAGSCTGRCSRRTCRAPRRW